MAFQYQLSSYEAYAGRPMVPTAEYRMEAIWSSLSQDLSPSNFIMGITGDEFKDLDTQTVRFILDKYK